MFLKPVEAHGTITKIPMTKTSSWLNPMDTYCLTELQDINPIVPSQSIAIDLGAEYFQPLDKMILLF